MKRLSLIAAGLLAFGTSAARADVGAAGAATTNGSDISEPTPAPTPTPPVRVDAAGNPLPTGDANVGINPAAPQPPPPVAGAPTTVEVVPPGAPEMPSGADVNVNPPAPAPRGYAPPPSSVRPPARVIDANTAAITGAVTEADIPVPRVQPPLAQQPTGLPDHGTMHDTDHTWVGRLGSGFLVGGGYEDFTNSNMRSQTGGGGSWAARALVGTRQFVGVEGAYVGAAHSVDALGVSSSAVLVSNGLEGDVRLNLPLLMRRAQLLEPFGFAGIGWQHYSVTNTNTNTSDLAHNDDVMTVPLGGGLEYAIGRFMADARFTYRPTYYNDLMRNGGSLTNWGVSGQVGISF